MSMRDPWAGVKSKSAPRHNGKRKEKKDEYLTLFDMRTEKEVDMGGTFDYFGELSHPDYRDITDEQYENRMILREAMISHGFKPIVEEWWHFTLENEPYPDTYFTFPINSDSLVETSSKSEGAERVAP